MTSVNRKSVLCLNDEIVRSLYLISVVVFMTIIDMRWNRRTPEVNFVRIHEVTALVTMNL
jgi:hypothetical protein